MIPFFISTYHCKYFPLFIRIISVNIYAARQPCW